MPGMRPGSDLIHRYAERLKHQAGQERARPPEPPSPIIAGLPLPAAEPPPAQAPAVPLAAPSTARRAASVKLDLPRLLRLGFIVPEGGDQTLLSEQFRQVKRQLIQKAFATGADAIHHGNVVMVTSARPREGKTFTAVNLALSLASERDLHVMLIDSDIYSRSVLDTLGLHAQKGLVDVLLDNGSDLSDVLLRTNIPNLCIVPAGTRHPHATELLASQRMARLTEEVSARYADRIIVVDSAPLLARSDPSVLAAWVGQILMVVEQNETGWHLVERSLSLIEGCPAISFVLNKVEKRLWEDDYASQYRH